MSTFFDFVQNELQPSIGGPSAVGISSKASLEKTVALSLANAELPEKEASDLAQKLGDLVTSPKFLQELSDQIETPRDSESEDAFVARSKSSLMDLLDRHLA